MGPPTCDIYISKTVYQNHPMVKVNGLKSWMTKDFWI